MALKLAAKRRSRLSLTSLIDVIFLLLLFFMLTSTFSRFAEVPISAAGAGGTPGERNLMFVRLGAENLLVNGEDVPFDALAAELRTVVGPQEDEDALDEADALAVEVAPEPATGSEAESAPDKLEHVILVSLDEGVTSQRLVDLLAVLYAIKGLKVSVLG